MDLDALAEVREIEGIEMEKLATVIKTMGV
jgi:hypothetical protein